MSTLKRAWELFDAKKHRRAAELGAELAEADPEDPNPPYLLGMCAIKLKDLPAAAEHLDRALALGHPHPDVLAMRGWVDLDLGRVDDGYPRLVAAAEQDPDSTVARSGVFRAVALRRDARGLALRALSRLEALSDKAWLAFLFAGIGVPLARAVIRRSPGLEVPVAVAAILLGACFFLGFLATPLEHLLLRTHPVARRLLGADAQRQGVVVGAALLTALLLGVAAAALGSELAGVSAFMLLLFTLPLSALFGVPAGRGRTVFAVAVAGLAAVGVAALGLKATAAPPGEGPPPPAMIALLVVYLLGAMFGLPLLASRLLPED